MNAHTQGPWTVGRRHPQNTTISVEDIDGQEVAVCYGSRTSRAPEPGTTYWPHDPEREANARLIAASPTMADYLRELAGAGDARAAAIMESIDATR